MFRLSVNIIYVLLSFSLVFPAVNLCIAIWILRWSHRQINRSRCIEIMSIHEKIVIFIHYRWRCRPFRTRVLLLAFYGRRPCCNSSCLHRRSPIQVDILIHSFVRVLLFFLFRKFSKIVNGIMIIITNFIPSFLFKCTDLIISFALLTPITIIFLLPVIIIRKLPHILLIRFLTGWFLLIYRGLGSVTFKITLKSPLFLLYIFRIYYIWCKQNFIRRAFSYGIIDLFELWQYILFLEFGVSSFLIL